MFDSPLCRHSRRLLLDSTIAMGWSTWEAAKLLHVTPREVWIHAMRLERDQEYRDNALAHMDEAPAQFSVGSNGLFYAIRWESFQALEEARKAGDAGAVQAATRQIQSLIALAASLDKQIDTEADAEEEFLQNPKWTDFKMRLLKALESYPEAYRAVLESLDV